MSEPFIGEIRAVGFNFAPVGWALCNGQTMPISQNSALFALLGTTFGGDGVQTFKLPDYQGRSPVGMGNGPGLTPIMQGEISGSESVTLLSSQMPIHTHIASGVPSASDATASVGSPAGAVAAMTAAAPGNVNMAPVPVTVQQAGGSQPVPLRNPYLGTNFIIATQGIFPSRP
jgi:microcystin-dependent protein